MSAFTSTGYELNADHIMRLYDLKVITIHELRSMLGLDLVRKPEAKPKSE